jgi:hypothetical protein
MPQIYILDPQQPLIHVKVVRPDQKQHQNKLADLLAQLLVFGQPRGDDLHQTALVVGLAFRDELSVELLEELAEQAGAEGG